MENGVVAAPVYRMQHNCHVKLAPALFFHLERHRVDGCTAIVSVGIPFVSCETPIGSASTRDRGRTYYAPVWETKDVDGRPP